MTSAHVTPECVGVDDRSARAGGDEPGLLIGGTWTRAATTFPVTDPASGTVVGHADDAGPDDAHAALEGAVAASAAWHALGPGRRGDILRTAAAAIVSDVDDLAELLSRECGKPVGEARGELLSGAATVQWAADEARRATGRTVDLGGSRRGVVLRQPVGVTVAISPWNFPASMLLRKIALALGAGCATIAKPAEQTPLIARALVDRFVRAGCDTGALSLLTTSDPEPLVDVLLGDPRVAKLSFTGSTEVGLMLLRREDRRLRRVALELGGHAPAIILPDADVDTAVDAVVASKFRNAGQSCIATNRLMVHESVHDRFVVRLREVVDGLRLGAGTDPGVDVGPLIDRDALDRLDGQVGDAVAKGARVLTGGMRAQDGALARGWFYRPTLLTEVDATMRLATEEIFGPVLPIFSFTDESAALAAANATDYGLAAYLYGTDAGRMWRLAEGLAFGVVGINDPFPLAPDLPFGGMKNSGLGREGGPEGMDGFLETKAVALHV